MGKKRSKTEDVDMENSVAKEDNAVVSESLGTESLSYEEKLKHVNGIAKPMAPKKLAKKIYKLIKKATKHKNIVHGIKATQRELRRGVRGIMVIAGDVTPIEVLCHFPGVCEDLGMPYVYTPCRSDLGEASGRKYLILVLIKQHEDYSDLYQECENEINKLPPPY